MKQLYVLLLAVFFTVQANGQGYDYLRILRSFPPIPENTLTAGKAEIDSYKEKLSKINDLLWDLEREQKEQQRKRENEHIPFDLAKLNKIDAAQEEWEKLYQQLTDITTPLQMEEMDIVEQWRGDSDSLMKVNEPYFKQLHLLNNKPDNAENRQIEKQARQQIYTNRLNTYKKLDTRNKNNLRKVISDYEKLLPLVEKLDNFTVDGYRISNGSVGLTALRDVYRSMERAYAYNAATEGEKSPFDAVQELLLMFPREVKDNP